jgi:hypothetical protein
MAKVKAVVDLLNQLNPEEEIVVAWWTFEGMKEIWDENNEDEEEFTPLTEEVWTSVASGEFDTEGTYDDIYQAIENEIGEA